MRMRWTAAGLAEAQHSFRRVKGHRDIPKLSATQASLGAVEPPASHEYGHEKHREHDKAHDESKGAHVAEESRVTRRGTARALMSA
jgi:hypothetical protein